MWNKESNPGANPWGMNYFAPPKGVPLPTPERRHKRPLPDQAEMFEIQRSLQRLSHEIDRAIQENPKADLDRVKHQFDATWKKFNRYLREYATQ